MGFLTFDSTIHFYNLQEKLSQPQMLVVSDIDGMSRIGQNQLDGHTFVFSSYLLWTLKVLNVSKILASLRLSSSRCFHTVS